MMDVDYESLWSRVAEQFPGGMHSLHGPTHWQRVQRNGLLLAERTGADAVVVRLFALFHDCRRVNDGWDKGHGERGAAYARQLRGSAFQLNDGAFELLHYACVWHTEGTRHEDVTIATCWDADRLDLGRVGVMPDPKRLCTEAGARIARMGGVEAWLRAPGK